MEITVYAKRNNALKHLHLEHFHGIYAKREIGPGGKMSNPP